ncbi:hypothetical protein KRR40_24250 [Niabella defluvii]|nr:hypothetical protein KRR40_24250 [Niabella sp. I65]
MGIINPGQPFKVVIEAHADEISWFVNYITDNGLIFLKRNGGVDHIIAPGLRVNVHGKKRSGKRGVRLACHTYAHREGKRNPA